MYIIYIYNFVSCKWFVCLIYLFIYLFACLFIDQYNFYIFLSAQCSAKCVVPQFVFILFCVKLKMILKQKSFFQLYVFFQKKYFHFSYIMHILILSSFIFLSSFVKNARSCLQKEICFKSIFFR